jgi:type II secretory pathway pseudopilin PulG
MRRGPIGFSLLELLVALLFMGLLLGGMVRVWRAGLGGWTRVNEALTARRALRWSLDRMAEDLRMMGCLFPPPELRVLDVAPQSGFRLVPGRIDGEPADELSWVTDVPVPVEAELDRAIPPGLDGEAAVWLRPARAMDLEAGDLLLVAGDRFEFARVAGPARLTAGRGGAVRVVRAGGAGAAFSHPHGAGALVQAVRPLRVVRYAVVRMDLDHGTRSREAGPVPCLVRFETACPRNGAEPGWREASQEVLARHVASFRVDFSPDLRFPGIRGADHAATLGNLAARLPGPGGGAGAPDPFWFRKAAGLIEVRLAIRGPVARRILERGQRLVVAPRNFCP